MNARRKTNQARLMVEPLENRLAPAWFFKLPMVAGENAANNRAEIELLSYSFGAQGSSQQKVGPSMQDVMVVKKAEPASPDLFMKCCNGTHIPQAILTMPKAGDAQPQPYFQYEFEQVYITSVRPGGDGGSDLPLEEVTLNFTKIQFDYRPSKAEKHESLWNLAQNQQQKVMPPR